MNKEVILTILYDYYGELLTDKQKNYFKYYYFDNLSLSEISEILNVSRNAIHKELKVIENKLYKYEEILILYKKDEVLKEILNIEKDINIKNKINELLK